MDNITVEKTTSAKALSLRYLSDPVRLAVGVMYLSMVAARYMKLVGAVTGPLISWRVTN